MFKDKLIDIGRVKAHKTAEVVFRNSDYAQNIVGVRGSCGCTNTTLDKDTGDIHVKFKPSSVPSHLKFQGKYMTSKYIHVTYSDGSTEVLILKAEVYE